MRGDGSEAVEDEANAALGLGERLARGVARRRVEAEEAQVVYLALSPYSCGCPHQAERWEGCMALGP
jgi:hypothetical protein